MPNIKLRDGSGVEQTYTGVDTITVPLADGTGTYTYGLTDDMLNLSDGNYHIAFFAQGSPLYKEDFYKNNYIIKRANLSDIHGGDQKGDRLFYKNTFIEDLSEITIGAKTFSTLNVTSFSEMFYGCTKLKKLPNFDFLPNAINGNQTNSTFAYCDMLEQTEMVKVYEFISYLNVPSQSPQLGYNYKITEFDWGQIDYSNWSDNFDPTRIDFSSGMLNLRKYIMPAICINKEQSSNLFNIKYATFPMLGDVSFVVDTSGNPFKSKMKSQVLSCGYSSYSWGYGSFSNDEYAKTGIDVSHGVVGDTLEDVQASYNNVKQYDDWHCKSNINVTYDNKQINVRKLFSRFNHASMVKIINTIMDTSEYLAEKGGTNTIKFIKYQGDLTDEGGASNLTPEEIAVATAKGWTVSIVV